MSPSVPFPWAFEVSSTRGALPRSWTAPHGRDCPCLGREQGIRQEKGWHGIASVVQWLGMLGSGKLTYTLKITEKNIFFVVETNLPARIEGL